MSDLDLIGFANEDFDEHISPTLSSIDQQTVQMGREAFKMLIGLIGNGSTTVNQQTKIVLEPVPFFRESTMRVPLKKSRAEKPALETGGF